MALESIKSASQLVAEMQEIYERADCSKRDLTPAERSDVEHLLVEIKSKKNIEDLGREIGLGAGMEFSTNGGNAGGPGDMFVKSSEYKRIKDPGARGHEWSTGPIQVSNVALSAKGTLLESTVGGPGGGPVPPAWEPGIVSKLFEPLGVSDVFGQSQTTASQIRYCVEGTATSGAAGVAEAAVKPESTIVMSETTEAIRKIATVLPISDEFLEDAPSIQTYLNDRLGLL
jgi:HK97 family phage major capsid protein